MFKYEYEKRARSPPDWAVAVPVAEMPERGASNAYPVDSCMSARALPPRPTMIYRQIHTSKTMVPLRAWAVAGAACLVICAAFALATLFVSQWGRDSYDNGYAAQAATSRLNPKPSTTQEETDAQTLEKLFQNRIQDTTQTDEQRSLMKKPQFLPEHDPTVVHSTKKIEKKDQPKNIPEFKPTLPDVFTNSDIKLNDGFLKIDEYYDYYDDYVQSNSMTSYLIEKVQELHDWLTSDVDLKNHTKKSTKNGFSSILVALNESLVEGNATIIMNKLKDLYYADDNSNRKIILTNNTNLLSFGILTLDVMLLHNIQLMAWENQESVRNKMMKDPDVFAFNALFMDPNKVEAKRSELHHSRDNSAHAKRQNARFDIEEANFAKNIFENVLEMGMSTARAAINLGRAYKNTKAALNQLSNRDKDMTQNIKQLSRNLDANTHALNHLQDFGQNDSRLSVATLNDGYFTELDCVWQLYCKNLVATTKLNAPYGVMARINGVALRMLSGELAVDKAIDTLLYEAVSGWTDLQCSDMFPRCSKISAASVVLESILIQPARRSQTKT